MITFIYIISLLILGVLPILEFHHIIKHNITITWKFIDKSNFDNLKKLEYSKKLR